MEQVRVLNQHSNKSEMNIKHELNRNVRGTGRRRGGPTAKPDSLYFTKENSVSYPFSFVISGTKRAKTHVEKKNLTKETVLKFTPTPGSRCYSPSSLTPDVITDKYIDDIINTNQRVCEKYGESHRWHHKHTITVPSFSLKQKIDNQKMHVVGISIIEWLDLNMDLSSPDARKIVSGANYTTDSITTAFVSVGQYHCPNQRRVSASCMVEWDTDEGERVELQVCSQIFFSVEETSKGVEMSLEAGGRSYISGFRGFSADVTEEQSQQIWSVLQPLFMEREEEVLHLPKKKGVCVIGDFASFEARKKPRFIDNEPVVVCGFGSESDSSSCEETVVDFPEMPEITEMNLEEEQGLRLDSPLPVVCSTSRSLSPAPPALPTTQEEEEKEEEEKEEEEGVEVEENSSFTFSSLFSMRLLYSLSSFY